MDDGSYEEIVAAYEAASVTCERQRAEIERLRNAAEDALAGWMYIRRTHGDLYGVGWDRVQEKLAKALKPKSTE